MRAEAPTRISASHKMLPAGKSKGLPRAAFNLTGDACRSALMTWSKNRGLVLRMTDLMVPFLRLIASSLGSLVLQVLHHRGFVYVAFSRVNSTSVPARFGSNTQRFGVTHSHTMAPTAFDGGGQQLKVLQSTPLDDTPT